MKAIFWLGIILVIGGWCIQYGGQKLPAILIPMGIISVVGIVMFHKKEV